MTVPTINPTNGVYQETLPNGLVVITEPMEYFHSVSVGVWLRNGSRREPAEINGISHFIEHMVFKGTHRRSAQDIAREVDRAGGMLTPSPPRKWSALTRASLPST